jgi:hypothetical protein
MARAPHPLRAEFDAIVLRHIAEYGPDCEWWPVVLDFMDRGVSRATVYRWIAAAVRRKPEPPPAPAAAPVVELLRECIAIAQDMIGRDPVAVQRRILARIKVAVAVALAD